MSETFLRQEWSPGHASFRVRVWTGSVQIVLETLEIESLSFEERARAARFRFREDERRFCASRLLLRQLVAEHLGMKPGDIRFTAPPGGRPVVIVPPGTRELFSSLSRSGDFCAAALSDEGEVGVDIERVREGVDFQAAGKAWLSEGENLAIRSMEGEPACGEAFFRLWCAREAVSKALGLGLAMAPGDGSVEGLLRESPVKVEFAGRTLEVGDLKAPGGYRLAAAVILP
jgi:4'-phosphopantetheinyl transferase